MATDSLHLLSVSEAAARLQRREITAEQLVLACLERIEQREMEVGAWAFVDPDGALAQARRLDASDIFGPLHGIPFGLKDIIDTADMPTSYGSLLYAGYRPAADATCVTLLKAAGAIVLGKTVPTEFGFRHPGKTRNPRNLAYSPGGSSSGSAAAVADDMVPFTMAAQTAGSVIRPAAYCGVYGFKPSYGVLSYSGISHLAESFDTLGYITRSLDDLVLLWKVLLNDERPATIQPGEIPRLGLCRTPYWNEAGASTHALFDEAVRLLEARGARPQEIDLGVDGALLMTTTVTITKFEASRLFLANHMRRPAGVSSAVRNYVADGMAITGAQYEVALKEMTRMRATMNAALAGFDAVLTPSAIGEAPLGLSDTGPVTFNFPWTVGYMPNLTMPAGNGENGMPLGMQLVAAQYGDYRLLSVAGFVRDAVPA